MSPARTSLISSRSLACICTSRPMRSLLALDRVEHRVARVQHAGVDAEEGQVADERVGRDLERQRRRTARRRAAGRVAFASSFSRMPLIGGISDGRRQVIDDRVEHGLHALVLERGAAQHRHDLARERARAQAALDLVLGRAPALEVLLHQLFVGLGRRLDELLAPVLARRRACPAGMSRVLEASCPGSLVPVDRLHLDQVDDALELLLGADRQLHRHRVRAEALLDLLDDAQEVRAGAVHLVDERDARHAVLVGLAPDRLGLRLDAADPQNTATAPSSTRSERSTSIVKSTWPGVSMMLMRCSGYCLSMPFQKQVVAADVIVMPRSCSCSIQSMMAAPSCTSPILCETPV